jgi:alpha-glucosidase
MKSTLGLAAFVVCLAAATAPPQGPPGVVISLKSPDGRTAIEVRRGATGNHETGGPLVYRVTRHGQDVLADSPLGIRRADQNFDAATLTFVGAADVRTIDERYSLPHGKAREHHVVARERTLHFKNPAGAPVDITLHAQNDGVAFRYAFPDRDAGAKTVLDEATGFHVSAGSTAWMLPRQPVGKYAPAYEDLFRQVTAGTASELPDGWDLPALFKTASGTWALVTESALDETYCGSHLAQQAAGGTYRIAFPDPGEGHGVGGAQPESTLPWTMPWRVIVVGDRAGDIIESNLVTDVAPASAIGTAAWVKPGRAAWSWWSMSDSPKRAEQLNAFTDLAAEMGWEYALVDANWNFMQTGTIEDVIAHAKEKRVGLLFWYNSGGPHNDVTEAPRDRMLTHEQRVKEFTQLRAWGVKGVKVDFWQSDKQDRIAQYRELLKDAADFQLMVDFHGSTIPRGWQREFPNLIGMEAVAGAEQYKFREDYAGKAPWLNTVLPFTRNAVGPMDFTPVTFSDAKYPHQTTNAHELALSVVFETPIQHFADSVDSYRSMPDAVKTFLKAVPTAWDETRVLSGEPGQTLVIARRAGDVWYIGAINGTSEAQAISLPTDFIGGLSWKGTFIQDGETPRTFVFASGAGRTDARPLVRGVLPHGGLVVRLERQ